MDKKLGYSIYSDISFSAVMYRWIMWLMEEKIIFRSRLDNVTGCATDIIDKINFKNIWNKFRSLHGTVNGY